MLTDIAKRRIGDWSSRVNGPSQVFKSPSLKGSTCRSYISSVAARTFVFINDSGLNIGWNFIFEFKKMNLFCKDYLKQYENLRD